MLCCSSATLANTNKHFDVDAGLLLYVHRGMPTGHIKTVQKLPLNQLERKSIYAEKPENNVATLCKNQRRCDSVVKINSR